MSQAPDILDSEILEIEKVLETLKDRVEGRSSVDRGQFDREITDRFNAIGFTVDTKWWHTNIESVKMPEITITGRTERREAFDHDKMAHEVTSDILGLGQGGVIKTTTDDTGKIRAVEEGHKHGPGCSH